MPEAIALGTPGDPEQASLVAQALMQQSTAITALVSQLATGDPISELSSSSQGGHGLSSKGVARRERMQRDLSEGQSQYFLQLQQQIHRKLYPSRPLPKREEDFQTVDVSLTSYLEKFGHFKNNKDGAMMMRMLAHVVDCAALGDLHAAKEHLALAVVALDQSLQDNSWSVAYVLSLLEEPPASLFQERPPQVSGLGRPFSGLVPQPWAAVALAFLREMELLTSKKSEAKAGRPSPKAADPNQESPKRRAKFPKKPKAGDAQPPQ